jgi:uncharacterized protein YbjT (DUF2867 family)
MRRDPMILVVGSTGLLGGSITRLLLERDGGDGVRVLVRSEEAWRGQGGTVERVRGDLKDADSLVRACENVDTVVTTANSARRGGDDTVESVDRRGNHDLIEAAAHAGVRRFVFVSVLGASPDNPVPFVAAKGETEELLRGTDMNWTILEPDAFMDVWVPAVVGGPALRGDPVVLVGEGNRRHSMIAVRDVAAFTVACLDHPAAERETIPLGGPEAVSWRDVVRTFGDALGREVDVRTVPPGDPVPGLPDVMVQIVTGMETYDSVLDMNVITATFGVRQTSLREFVDGFVAAAR